MKQKLMLLLACLLMGGAGLVVAQNADIKGIVTSSEDNEPVVGASVLVEGTTLGSITNIDGEFTIANVPSSAKTLRVTYVGMQTQSIHIVRGKVMHIQLNANAELLEEVVVTGYGVTKKAAFTGAATTLGSDKIEGKNDVNPIKSLEGAVPGLQMSVSSGQPGAPAYIYVRGRNSLNSGTQPLYVVDGVPYFADAIGVRSDEGQTVSPLSSLNSNDIESITVLKDATATSIYGARAANGVVVITTKKGKSGKPSVNFTAKVGFETMPSMPDKYKSVDAAKHLELATEALLNAYKDYGNNSTFGNYNEAYGLGCSYDKEGALDFYDWYTGGWYSNHKEYGYDTNWLDEVTRTGLIQEYGVDISGGGRTETAAKYYLSMNYLDEKAIVIGKDLTRYSFRFNLEQAPSKWVKFGFNTNLSYTDINMGSGGGYFSDPITMAYMMNPLTPVRDQNGEWNWDTSYVGYNPVAQRSDKGDKSNAKQYRGSLAPWVQINFSPKLFWLTRASIDLLLADEFGYWSFMQPQGKEMRGMGENNYTTNTQLSVTNTLNYIDTFKEKHHVNFLLGQEGQKTLTKYAYLEGSNYPVDYLNQVSNSAVPSSASTSKYELVLASFFANAQYDYDNKYYLSASLRYDGSSRFGSNNRWAGFWSVGAKYRVSAEKFMEGTKDWLTNLTLRASYGTSGNQEVGNGWYASRDLFGFGYNYNNLPGMAHEQFGNPDLKWEQTKKFNVGVDITLFDRINIELDYYKHKTTDMVFAVPLSYTTGISSYYKNIGELSNKGFEMSIGAQIIKSKDWQWDVTVTGSLNKNKVEKLSTDMPIEGAYQTTEVGYPIYQFKMKEYAGVDPETGAALWYLNETGDETTTAYNKAAKRYLGSPNPDFAGSISSTLKWKGFDLAIQLNYSLGAKIYGDNLRYDEQIGGSFYENFTNYVYENRWQKPGDITDVPRLTTDGAYENSTSSRFLMDGDYLKIRSLTVGYTLPQSWLKKSFVNNCRVFMNAENLYTICADNYRGFDPAGIAASGVQWWNYPLPRSVMFGVTLGF